MENEKYLIQTKQRSSNEKLIITAQNVLLKQYFEETFNIPVYDISRDKEDHPIFLSILDKEKMHAYTLAIRDETKEITPFQVGKVEYDNEYYSPIDSFVEVVGVHDAFAGKGIGTIILQGAENYFTELNKNAVELEMLRTFTDISKNKLTYSDIIASMNPEQAERYIKRNFYDTNLFFYTSMGYVKISSGDKYGVLMRKKKIKNIPITYGFERPLSLSRSETSFRIPSIFTNYFEQLKVGQKRNFFNKKSTNIFQSEKISPIQIKPTIDDTRNMDLIFSHLEPCNGIYANQLALCFENNKKHSTKNSDISKLAKESKNKAQIQNSTHQTYQKCINALNQFIEPEIERE